MVQPLLTPLLNTASGAVSERARAGLRAGVARARGVLFVRGVLERGVLERPVLAPDAAVSRGVRARAAVVLPRADPARARLVVVLRDLPAMPPG